MTPIRDFVGALAVARKFFKEIEETVKKVYGDKALKRTQIYDIMKTVKEGKPTADQRGFNTKRRIRNSAFVTDIAAEVESNRRVTVRKLARNHGMSTRTIHEMLHGDLNLSKKSAIWLPKLLSDDMKKERRSVRRHSMSMLKGPIKAGSTPRERNR
jgi:hypothetical protein